MECSWILFILCLTSLVLLPGTFQLQSSQSQVLLQLRKHLEYPKALEVWDSYKDLCYLPSSPQISIVCQDNSVTELRIMGDKPSFNISKFYGFPITNVTLSDGFSIDSFVTTLARLSTLRVLSLVSLGIWGSLSDKIHRLRSLESLDLCSNFMYGMIPPKISVMDKLQTLTLNENFFNGSVPDWFDSLSNLTMLGLKNNALNGTFPSSIRKLEKLTDLVLSQNRISGRLPDLSSLTNLHVLDLRENQLESELPSMPKGLVNALLSKNFFSGEIPQQFGKLFQLQHLDMSFNLLRGTPPAKLFSLPNISYLNLASNMLTGTVPNHLHCSGVLGFVDISNNRLAGELPSCLRSSLGNRVVKFSGNCLSVDLQNQHQISYCDRVSKRNRSAGKKIGVLVAVVGGIVLLMVFLAFGLVVLCRRYCPRGTSEQRLLTKSTQDKSAIPSELLASARFLSEASKLGTQGIPVYRIFTVDELKEATANFDQSMFMGKGSIGETKLTLSNSFQIYKGRLENGTYVAIRCLALFKRYSIRNLKLRLDLLSKLRHPNLVCLLGHCIDGGEKDDSKSSPEKVLKWSERLAVSIGIAKAVHFLHTGMLPGFFNNQLKTKNILLDENGIAKLSDYGLSIITKEIDKIGVRLGDVQAKEEDRESCLALAKGAEPAFYICLVLPIQPSALTVLQPFLLDLPTLASIKHMTKLEDDVFSFGFILLEMLVGPTAGKGESILNEMYAAQLQLQAISEGDQRSDIASQQ
ncbi:hypothetical protein IFM89_002580 [Coptis chinensis]|uniref:Protein kinase domain-containing protein n=1 Tax=Coptis chinensis TaxID=261450 RepID=A0A835LQB6_9MAGN|nr:hypothetical protein IFM89_002580 [Coptis chinensis]